MRQKLHSKRLLTAICLVFLSLTLSGCVYLRLLSFKNQLKSFDQNVSVESSPTLIFGFRDPVVRDSDFIFISGASPGKIDKIPQFPSEEIWTWTFEKRKSSPAHQPYTMEFRTRFKDGLLTQMEIDETFVALVGGDLILTMFRNIGNAKINKLRRSMSAELDNNSVSEMPLPSLAEIIDVMGEPTRIAKPQSGSVARCEYEFNFLNPENGRKAGQFRLYFTGSIQDPQKAITHFKITGKAR